MGTAESAMSAYGGIPELAVETNERKPRSIPKIVMGIAAAVLVAVGIIAIVNGSSADTTATSTDSTTELYTAAGFQVTTYYKCINPTCTDSWCDANCNHRPVYCPASFCKKVTVRTPVPAPPPPPPPVAAPTPAPTPAPTDAPTPAPPSSACPNNGILGTSWYNSAGVQETSAVALICCPAECGNCAGDGCAKWTGGPDNCCAQKVMPQKKSCSDSAPPCILEAVPGN